jgi:hypothetical protein
MKPKLRSGVYSMWCLTLVIAQPVGARTIAHWRFEEGSADVQTVDDRWILDVSGHGLHGTSIGTPTYRAVTSPYSTLALEFDGVDDRVYVPDHPLFELTGSLTLEAFIRVDSLPRGQINWAQIVFRGDERGGLDPYFLAIVNLPGHPNHGKLAFQVQDAENKPSAVYSPSPVPLGKLLHVAGTLDDASGEQKLFIDGVEVASRTTATRPLGPLDASQIPGVGIGNVETALPEFFNGLIDEVRISDVALAPDQFLPGIGSASAAVTPGRIIAGPVMNPANGHLYYLLKPSSWSTSEAEARSLGGHLVTINDQAEQDWVWRTFGDNGRRFLWIGLADRETEGEFVWSSGEPLAFTNWTPGEPNDAAGGEDFIEMDAARGGLWNDLSDWGQGFQHGVVEVVPGLGVPAIPASATR